MTPRPAAWHAEAQRLRDEGLTLSEIGAQFGVTRERVRQVTGGDWRAAREARRRMEFAAAHGPRTVRLWRDGETPNEIARALRAGGDPACEGTLRQRVRSFLLDEGVTEEELAERVRERHRDVGRAQQGQSRWSDADALAAIALASGGAPLAKSEYDRVRLSGAVNGPSGAWIVARMGKWNDALRRAGVPPTPSVRSSYDPIPLRAHVEALGRVAGILGRDPSMAEYERLRRADDPGEVSVRMRLGRGSWVRALTAAGL